MLILISRYSAQVLSISTGSDPGYLTKAVGQGAEHYYLRSIDEAGEPPGVWLGLGASDLGLSGEVSADVMTDLYTDFIDPRRRDEMYARLAAITAEKGSDAYKEQEAQIRADARLGSAPRSYEKAYEKRLAAALSSEGAGVTPERIRQIEMQVRRDAPSATLYYDLTFSAPKSWSVYHASLQVQAAQAREAGDLDGAKLYSEKAQQVWDAWMTGVQAGVDHMQEQAGYSRAGHHGEKVQGRTTGRYVDAHEFTAAAFRQHTSRNDDPQLHVHVAVLNKVKTIDIDPVTGQERVVWRALDGQGLFRHKQAAGHLAERVAEQELERNLGVRVAMRPDGKAREIVGIDQELRDSFSSRRVAIKEGVAELAKAYEERHGIAPSPYALARMSEHVTLDQRQAKKHDAPSREVLLQRWEDASKTRLRDSLAEVPDQVALQSAQLDLDQPYEPFNPETIKDRAIRAVQLEKSTWTKPDLIVELNRQLPDTLGGLESHQVRDLLSTLADEALSPVEENGVVRTTAPYAVSIPEELTRADGSFVYEPNPDTFVRYATEEHLVTEERIAQFAVRVGGPRVPAELVEEVIAARGLNEQQAKFVREAATSGRMADLLVGPAGTGKSYAMAALTEVWERNGGDVIGLASSERAAQVLAEEGIANIANITKLLTANEAMAAGARIADADQYQIRPGQLVIVDEAGMTSTTDVDQVRRLIEASGAKMILSGDWGQLSAPGGAGGMFGQLSEDLPHVHTLEEVRRFRDIDLVTGQVTIRHWEADASLRLRAGESDVLDEYEARGRLRGGTAEQMTERAYQGWLVDHLEGRNPLLIASTNEQAAELAARARADLVRAGLVEENGVLLRTASVETRAGRGDLIQLRRNDRTITNQDGSFAVNRAVARVTGLGDDGSLTVRLGDGGLLRLPATYVREHVELAYATTVHGAQGRTVGTAHSLVDEGTSRESLYVALTRGAEANWAYIITHDPAEGFVPEEEIPHHLAVLDGTLQRTELEQTATQVVRGELERREHLAVLEPVWADVKDRDAELRFGRALRDALGDEEYRTLTSEEAYGSLMRLTRHAEEQGRDAEQLLVRTATSRELDDADSHSSVLYWRMQRALDVVEQDEIRAERAEQHRAVTEQERRVDEVTARGHEAQVTVTSESEIPETMQHLLAQNEAMQQLSVAHAQQDSEVRRRQWEERDSRMEAMDSYLSRTPEMTGAVGWFARDWAVEMDARTERLGQQVAENEPRWAVDRLGPVPEDPTRRADWETRAGRIERYREAHGYTSETDAIGSAPPRGAVEARSDWERARRALGVPENQLDIARASDATLQEMVDGYRREEAWAPAHVAEELQRNSLARDDYRSQAVQLQLRAQEMAEQEAAEHQEQLIEAVTVGQLAPGHLASQQLVGQVMEMQHATTLQYAIDPSERQREIEDRAQTSDMIAETMGERADKLTEIHEARQGWHQETERQREEAYYAQQELERRLSLVQPEQAESKAVPPAAEAPYARMTGDELEQALQQARAAQQILAERLQERADADRAVETGESAERDRRDEGFAYQAAQSTGAGIDHGLDMSAGAAQSEPAVAAPMPEPVQAPEPPQPEIEL